jgi:hypothetical protein
MIADVPQIRPTAKRYSDPYFGNDDCHVVATGQGNYGRLRLQVGSVVYWNQPEWERRGRTILGTCSASGYWNQLGYLGWRGARPPFHLLLLLWNVPSAVNAFFNAIRFPESIASRVTHWGLTSPWLG